MLFLKLFILQRSEDSMTTSHGHRIATEGAKVASASEDSGNLRNCDHCTDEDPVSNSLYRMH